jgi:acetyl esterase/lipase
MRLILTLILSLMAGTAARAQAEAGAMQACGPDYRRLCSGVRPGGGRILACLDDHRRQLSEGCGRVLEASAAERPAPSAPALATPGKTLSDIAYGSDQAQRFDVYRPDSPQHAPLIVMLHGGGWARGDKTIGRVVDGKVRHWLSRGYIFVSINTRLLPKADPLEQAADLGAALAAIQARAASWGGDPTKIVLMGHSAGAHLAALLSADPATARNSGLRPWLATVAIDSAALDIPAIMQRPHFPLYDRAFGTREEFWRQASPLHRLRGTTLPMLLICSSLRRDACPQAERFAAATGARAQVLPIALGHGALNADLGVDEAYTGRVDAFLRGLNLP